MSEHEDAPDPHRAGGASAKRSTARARRKAADAPTGRTLRAQFVAAAEDWNRLFNSYRDRARALCWPPKGPARPLGELLAVDLGLGAPPHGGVGELRRLLAIAVRRAFDDLDQASKHINGILSAGAASDWMRVDAAFQSLLEDDEMLSEKTRLVGAAVGLALRARVEDEEGGVQVPRRQTRTALGLLTRVDRRGRVPHAAMPVVRLALDKVEVAGPHDLLREAHAALHGWILIRGSQRGRGGRPGDPGPTVPARELGLLPVGRGLMSLGGTQLRYSKGTQKGLGFSYKSREGKLLCALAQGRDLPGVRGPVATHVAKALEVATGYEVSIRTVEGVRRISHSLTLSQALREKIATAR